MATLRIRALPRLPISAQAADGLAASISSGTLTVSQAWEGLSLLDNTATDNKEFIVRDSSTDTYSRISVSSILDLSTRNVGDENVSVLPTDNVIALTETLTSTRAVNLPARTSVQIGKELTFIDMVGGISPANAWFLQRASSDVIVVNGASVNFFYVPDPYSCLVLRAAQTDAGQNVWQLIERSTALSVTDFGAPCDGSVDGSTQIQAAVNRAKNTGQPVVIPPGQFRIDSQITYFTDSSVAQGLRIFGAGSSGDTTSATVIDSRVGGAAFYISGTDGRALSATVAAGGSGYTNGTQTLTLSGGTFTTAAQFTVTVSGGAVTAVTGVAQSGSYLIPPGDFSGGVPGTTNSIATTGGGGTGATLNVAWNSFKFNKHGRLSGFTIVSNPTGSPTASSAGILLRSVWNYTLEDVVVAGMASDGIRIVSSLPSGDPDSSSNIRFINVTSRDNGGCGLWVNSNSATGTAGISYVWAENSGFYGNAGENVKAEGYYHLSLRFCSLEGSDAGGFYSVTRGQQTTIEHSSFGNDSPFAIKILGGQGGRIVGNLMTLNSGETGTQGIVLDQDASSNASANFEVDANRWRIDGSVPSFTAYTLGSGAASQNKITNSNWLVFGQLQALSATIQSAGAGYTPGTQTLTLSGGTFTTAAQLTVTVDGAGTVTAVTGVAVAGNYSVVPGNPVSVTGGGGAGATFNVTFSSHTRFSTSASDDNYIEDNGAILRPMRLTRNAVAQTPASAFAVDFSKGSYHRFTVSTAGSGTITISTPTNADNTQSGRYLHISIINSSGSSQTLSFTTGAVGSFETTNAGLPSTMADGTQISTEWRYDSGAQRYLLIAPPAYIDLPLSSLAQGTALSLLGVAGNATADHADIAAASDNQVMRRSGTSIGFGAIALGSSNAVSGVLAVANGGTNASSASGTALDNITGFSSTGILVRTASGTYAFRTATGTSNRITVTNGDGVSGNQTFDISNSYVGQATITTLGTIGTGTWNATVIAGQYGGTGVANTGKTITVSGNTTIGSSTDTVAFTTSGNTSVALPTSGTLAALSGTNTWTGVQTHSVSGAAQANFQGFSAIAAGSSAVHGNITLGNTASSQGGVDYNGATGVLYLYNTFDSASGNIILRTRVAGTDVDAVTVFGDGGVNVGSPTGGNKGVGTLNAVGVYDDNVLLTDYVFDLYLDRGAPYENARVQAKYDALDRTMFDARSYADYWRKNGRLYGMPDLNECVSGRVDLPLGELIQRLMQTVELQAIHISQLEKRIKDIELQVA